MQFEFRNSRPGCLTSTPKVTKMLIIINLVVFALTAANGSLLNVFAVYYPTSPHFHWYQIITHLFTHGGFFHLFFNMYTLFIFGSVVERIIGQKKFLFLYFICGLGAVGLHFGAMYFEMQSYMDAAALGNQAALYNINAIRMTPTVGASGAIYGLLIAYAMLFPESRMSLIFPPITLSAKWMVVAFAAIELLLGFTGQNASVAHFAHLGGMLIGYLMVIFWRKRGNLFNHNNII